MLQNLPKSKFGFTLVEVLVATSIFTMSILTVMSILADGISDTNYAKKKITAAYLAQEGVEYVRNLRDTYILYSGTPGAGWTAFNNKLLAASCQSANGCYFDDRNVSFTDVSLPMTDLIITTCNSSCPGSRLRYNSSTGKYGYASGTPSEFTRRIRITQVTAHETKIFSTVYWTQGSGTYSTTFSENLFNWVE